MIAVTLQNIADLVIRRAKREGYVLPDDIRKQLTEAGLPENQWEEVAALIKPSLTYRRGKFCFVEPISERVQRERTQQRVVRKVIRQIIRRQRDKAGQVERRGQDRIEFIQPVKVVTEDGRELTLLTRDLSISGIRLVGTRRLLGHKVRVLIPREDRATPWTFLVRILWTCALGDDLVENGGTFIEVSSQSEAET